MLFQYTVVVVHRGYRSMLLCFFGFCSPLFHFPSKSSSEKNSWGKYAFFLTQPFSWKTWVMIRSGRTSIMKSSLLSVFPKSGSGYFSCSSQSFSMAPQSFESKRISFFGILLVMATPPFFAIDGKASSCRLTILALSLIWLLAFI